MTAVFITILVSLLAVIVLLTVLLQRRSTHTDSGLTLLQQQLDALRQQTAAALETNARALTQATADMNAQLNARLGELSRIMQENTGQLNTRLDNAARVVKDVSETLGELSRSSQQILDVGKDIASLQEILRAPKLRGEISEFFLEDLLRQVIPNHYAVQHQFRSGEKVDAVIRLGDRLVPVDAKFPLENFKRLLAATTDTERSAARRQFNSDVRKHVDTIASKYIRPDEGTFDFALMYIMAENVYYETVIRPTADEPSLGDYAISRRVVPVSPNTLYAHLQTIVLGLRGFAVEKRAGEILALLSRLQAEFSRFREEFEVLGRHIANARTKYEEADKRINRFEERLAMLTQSQESPTTEPGEQLPGSDAGTRRLPRNRTAP